MSEIDLYTFCPKCKSDLHEEEIDKEQRKVCPTCGFVFWNNPKPVVSMLIHRDGKILMLQRAQDPFKGYWVLPGGFIGYSETAQKAVIREVYEETGLDVVLEGIIGVYRIDNDPRGVHIDIIFHGESDKEPILSKEDIKWEYFDPASLPEHIAYKHKKAIMDWAKS